eukprot:357537-Chlamydomonas_euryale.AAC.1
MPGMGPRRVQKSAATTVKQQCRACAGPRQGHGMVTAWSPKYFGVVILRGLVRTISVPKKAEAPYWKLFEAIHQLRCGAGVSSLHTHT